MATALVALGSNLGDRQLLVEGAIARLGRTARVKVAACSRWHETAPIGGPEDQGRYLNGAAVLTTSLEPEALLGVLRQIEVELGRKPAERWSARTIDLDLLLYDDEAIETPTLVVPHPRMAWRRFVLAPAAEVAPAMVHPLIGWTVARLRENLDATPNYVAITGPIGSGKSSLARRLAEATGARLISEAVDGPALAEFYADPAGHAGAMELEFLRQRADWLAKDNAQWQAQHGLWLSDFWFEQSPAFASVWLADNELAEFTARYEEAAERAVRPKLIVVLDAPTDRLLERIRARGRAGEDRLDAATLDRIRAAIAARTRQPDCGPVLRVVGSEEETFNEALWAIESME